MPPARAHERSDAIADVVANLPDALERLTLGIGEIPVGALDAGNERTRFTATHRDQQPRVADERIRETLRADQRRILALSQEGYAPGEIARELALTPDYVQHFMTGLVQRLTHERLIPSPDWRNALRWAVQEGLLPC